LGAIVLNYLLIQEIDPWRLGELRIVQLHEAVGSRSSYNPIGGSDLEKKQWE
jgi:hypothetical protein